jgi:23S rRNA pseudouridine2605 synthase
MVRRPKSTPPSGVATIPFISPSVPDLKVGPTGTHTNAVGPTFRSGARPPMPPTRLQKILSTAGIASRRSAEELITQGRVTVNGATVTELGSKADPNVDDIRVDGRRVKAPARRRYFLLNKPRGYITSRADPQHRPTVIDILARHGIREYIYPVGRLDYESEGLLILTSDGDLAAMLTHPSHGVGREYEVRVLGVPNDHEIERLTRGVVIDGRRTAPAEVERTKVFETSDGRVETLLSMVIHEWRNRQVRKMCEAIGHPVVRLRRVGIGPIKDAKLRPGDFRELTADEIATLKKRASGKAAPSRSAPHSRIGPGPRRKTTPGRGRRRRE